MWCLSISKLQGPGYSLFPEFDKTEIPWDGGALILIGPLTILVGNHIFTFFALACVGPVKGLTEITKLKTKLWMGFSCQCIHDNVGKFTGWTFKRLLETHGIEDVPTTSCKPIANAICKCMQQMLWKILWTLLNTNPPITMTAAKSIGGQRYFNMHACSANNNLYNSWRIPWSFDISLWHTLKCLSCSRLAFNGSATLWHTLICLSCSRLAFNGSATSVTCQWKLRNTE